MNYLAPNLSKLVTGIACGKSALSSRTDASEGYGPHSGALHVVNAELTLPPEVRSEDVRAHHVRYEDFTLENYQCHPGIKAPISV